MKQNFAIIRVTASVMSRKIISFVIPCFNEEENVGYVYSALKEISTKLKNYEVEFVYVDNGSSDNTRNEIKKLTRKDKRVSGVFLSRNFGPESSVHAGLDHIHGDAAIVYESDLQDPPEVILQFVKKWEEGYDVVLGVRTKIEDNFAMTFFRTWFYKILKLVSDIEIPVNSGSYSLMTRRVVDNMQSLPEKFRMMRGLRAWVGFKTAYITYHRRRRQRGKSSYNFFRYVKHAERSFFGFSYLPLDIMIYSGFLLVFFSFLFIVGYLLFFLLFGNPIKGAVTILVAIVFFGGIQLMAMSILGKYIQVIMEETKSRPVYIVDQIVATKKKRSYSHGR